MTLRLLQVVAWSLFLMPLIPMATGCSDANGGTIDPCLTSLRINLEVDGATINEVEYKISGNGMEPRGGTINTGAPGTTASVEEFGIVPGEGYLVEMEATSIDEDLRCGGSSTFDVGAGITTEVDFIEGRPIFPYCPQIGRFLPGENLKQHLVLCEQVLSGSERERCRRHKRCVIRKRLLQLELDRA